MDSSSARFAGARVSMLVLAHLGLAASACTKEPAPEAPAAPLVVGTGSPTTTPTPPASTIATVPLASSSAQPAVPTARPDAPRTDKTCKSDLDCTGWDYCSKRENEVAGTCAPRPTRGRALVVEGVAHVASVARYARAPGPATSATRDEIDALRQGALEEHASVAAFARTICELMALGAPLALLAETHAALGDELRHTERTLAMLAHLTGERPAFAGLAAAAAPLARSTEDLFRDIFRGGTIGETLAAVEAEVRRSETESATLRAFYEMLAIDEARHAALAFKTLRWLLVEDPRLAPIAREERARMSVEDRWLVVPLLDAAAIG